MKNRTEISDKYKWDLSILCKDIQDCEQKLDDIQKEMQKFKEFNGNLSTEKNIFEFFLFNSYIRNKLKVCYSYAHLKLCEDGESDEAKALYEKALSVFSEQNILIAPCIAEIDELSVEFLEKLMKNKEYPQFKNGFRRLIRNRPHKLSKEQKILVSEMSSFSGNAEQIFDALKLDLKIEPALDKDGKEHFISLSSYGILMENADRDLRKNVMKNFNTTFKNFNNTLSANYIYNIKEESFFNRIKKFNSSIESYLFYEEINEEIYINLINKVTDNLNIFHRFFKLKRRELNLKDFAIYDLFIPFDFKLQREYTYENSIEIIKNALAPLGKEYVEIIQKAYDERWIDVFENKGKQSGAFAHNSLIHPFVLMNFNNNLNSVFTLTHELGHALHGYFSHKHQPVEDAWHTILLAEITSNVNEMLLFFYLFENLKNPNENNINDNKIIGDKDDKVSEKDFCEINTKKEHDQSLYKSEKKNLFNQLLLNFYGSVMRQTLFSKFEYEAFKTYEKTKVLSSKILNDIYWNLNREFFGNHIKLIPEIKFEWSRIPHFYSPFYVHNYVTGLLCAIKIAKKLKENDEKTRMNYIKFISAGASVQPLEALKIVDIDLEDPNVFDDVFNYINSILDEWEKM